MDPELELTAARAEADKARVIIRRIDEAKRDRSRIRRTLVDRHVIATVDDVLAAGLGNDECLAAAEVVGMGWCT